VTLPPVLDAAGRPADQIRLVGVRATGHHGVLESERRDGQEFAVDVVLHLDTRPAAASDDLGTTVDYGALARVVAGIVRGESVQLIETLADRIARACLVDPAVLAADVAVHKPAAPIAERFDDVVLAVRRYRGGDRASAAALTAGGAEVDAVLALGANLGDRMAILRSALSALSAVPGIDVRAVSGVWETAPVGGPPQPDYLNAVILIRTRLPARALLAAGHGIEAALGRRRGARWGPRSLDIDLIAYADLINAEDDLEVPHPRASGRAFVLAPWNEVDPRAVLPGAAGPRRVADLLAAAADRPGVRERPDLLLELPGKDPS
jgi:dihydroneopterin aldolase / 2-amino-4-hydroxy-6-hydroxymethyldihydropteridine diphosphokinase